MDKTRLFWIILGILALVAPTFTWWYASDRVSHDFPIFAIGTHESIGIAGYTLQVRVGEKGSMIPVVLPGCLAPDALARIPHAPRFFVTCRLGEEGVQSWIIDIPSQRVSPVLRLGPVPSPRVASACGHDRCLIVTGALTQDGGTATVTVLSPEGEVLFRTPLPMQSEGSFAEIMHPFSSDSVLTLVRRPNDLPAHIVEFNTTSGLPTASCPLPRDALSFAVVDDAAVVTLRRRVESPYDVVVLRVRDCAMLDQFALPWEVEYIGGSSIASDGTHVILATPRGGVVLGLSPLRILSTILPETFVHQVAMASGRILLTLPESTVVEYEADTWKHIATTTVAVGAGRVHVLP